MLKKHTKHRWLGMSHMLVLGACWTQTHFGEKAIFGERSTKVRKDRWKEDQHMQGIPNDVRVRVFSMYWNG
jgi:hypothetical protein